MKITAEKNNFIFIGLDYVKTKHFTTSLFQVLKKISATDAQINDAQTKSAI
jgi:hypothetical protein